MAYSKHVRACKTIHCYEEANTHSLSLHFSKWAVVISIGLGMLRFRQIQKVIRIVVARYSNTIAVFVSYFFTLSHFKFIAIDPFDMFAWKWRTFGFLNFSHYLLLLLSYILSKLDSFPRSTCLAEAILSRRLSSFQPTTRVGYSAKRSLFHIFLLKIQSLRHFQDFVEIAASNCYWWV